MLNQNHKKIKIALIIGALGVVFGDIGTSPLYALKEAFFGLFHLERNFENVTGVLSLFFWTLMIIVTIKYIMLIMRAENHGEGGIFTLLALIREGRYTKKFAQAGVGIAILIGAALLYGDGIITPAISVLSAVEGLNVATLGLEKIVVPLTIIILIILFSLQKGGSGKVGKLFGPVMIVWFLVLIALGLPEIIKHPEVLHGLNPLAGIDFIHRLGWSSLLILGAVVLCITGAEALYADMGHFGKRAITVGWLSLVYPALTVNYFGQGAKLLSLEAIPNNHLFYSLVPSWALIPVVALATIATVIASQALISGAFSLTNQAISLGLFPRVKIVHTNPEIEGQIFLPFINLALLVGCILLVLGFKNSSGLAAAYGIAVTGTMAITTLAFFILAYKEWRWPFIIIGPICALLGIIDLTFFSANVLKFWQGGWVPIIFGVGVFLIMYTWQWGKRRVARAYAALPGLTVKNLIDLKEKNYQLLLNRSVVVLASKPILNPEDKVPVALDSFCDKWGVSVPKHLIFLSVLYLNKPRVISAERYKIMEFQKNSEAGSIFSIQVYYGYMQTPNIRQVLDNLKEEKMIKIPAEAEKWLILISVERFTSGEQNLIRRFQLTIFRSIMQISKPVTSYFGLGADPKVAIETINI